MIKNLLRTNVQAFAATLAGCDSITLAHFENDHDERDLDKARLARNQLILLRDESSLQRVQDPCRGSYAIEALTDAVARGAWTFVQDVEERGGIVNALDDGFIQDRIAASSGRRRAAFATGSRTLVGTSRFVDARFQKTDRPTLDAESIQHHMFAYLARRLLLLCDRAIVSGSGVWLKLATRDRQQRADENKASLKFAKFFPSKESILKRCPDGETD